MNVTWKLPVHHEPNRNRVGLGVGPAPSSVSCGTPGSNVQVWERKSRVLDVQDFAENSLWSSCN